MRRIKRLPLNDTTLKYLAKQQNRIDKGIEARRCWSSAQKSKAIRCNVAGKLREMAGRRERCMYCQDSRATEIDHFWPLSSYPQRTFCWENLLHSCAGCNRRKTNRFELGPDGTPLLIDPTAIDPWDHLYYEPTTGMLAARYIDGVESRLGAHTTDPEILPLNIDAITMGRQRTARNLSSAVREFLSTVDKRGVAEATSQLVQAISDHDDFGLAEWFFKRDGSTHIPFATLRANHKDAWQAVVDSLDLVTATSS